MNKTKTRCKVCLSEQKDYIEEMLRDKVPLNIISGRMLEVYNEQISADAVARHRDHHMPQPHSNNDRVQEVEKVDETHSDETHSEKVTEVAEEEVVAEEPLTKTEALEARINAIEIIMVKQASTATNTTFRSYDMAGEHTHGISYRDIANELHPDKKDIHGQYRAIVNSIKAKMIKEQGLCLSDAEFIGPREEKRKKEREEEKEKMNAAEQAMENAAAEKLNAQNRLAGLGAVGT